MLQRILAPLARRVLPALALLLAFIPAGTASAQGWERVYTLDFTECTRDSLREYGARIGSLPGHLDHRPIRCDGTRCAYSYVSTASPNALLNSLYAMVQQSGYRARIGVEGLRYDITCLPGRRVHPLAGEPRVFAEFATPCGSVFEAGGDILFDFDRAAIRADAVPALRALADRIARMRPLAVEITGHTDARGTAAYNQGLSERRAESVARYLTGPLGLRHPRLVLRGLGEFEPRAPNTYPDGSDYPAGRQANRRVEIFLRTGDCGPTPAPLRPLPRVQPDPVRPGPPPLDPDQW